LDDKSYTDVVLRHTIIHFVPTSSQLALLGRELSVSVVKTGPGESVDAAGAAVCSADALTILGKGQL